MHRKLTIGVVAAFLAACGGEATRPGPSSSSAGQGGGSGSAGEGAGGTSVAGGGSAPNWLADLALDEAFPWFVQDAGGPYQMAADDGDAGLVHVTLEGEPLQTSVTTHNHLGVVGVATAVSFRAKADRPFDLLVSVRAALEADYFSAKAEGRLWPVAPVPVGLEWQSFTVAFADMMPPESEPPENPPAFTIAFIVDERSGPLELWLDDVKFQ